MNANMPHPTPTPPQTCNVTSTACATSHECEHAPPHHNPIPPQTCNVTSTACATSYGSRSKTHARLLVSEWHLQIWMVCFCCSGERPRMGGERFAKGLNTTSYQHICHRHSNSIHARQFNCRIATGSVLGAVYYIYIFIYVYNTLTDICIEWCRHLLLFVDGYEQVSVSYCPMFLNWQWHPD